MLAASFSSKSATLTALLTALLSSKPVALTALLRQSVCQCHIVSGIPLSKKSFLLANLSAARPLHGKIFHLLFKKIW